MKVYITRDWSNKTYEIWSIKPEDWRIGDNNYYAGKNNYNLFRYDIAPKEAKKLFNLPRHLKKKEICEGTMTFKVNVK